METDPMTMLDAVNIVLRNDGESPVASLTEDGFGELADAQAAIIEVSRTVQDAGWAFNTDYAYKLIPDALTDEITVPTATLWVRPAYTSRGRALVERARKLYDLEANSYSFSAAVYVDVCQMLEFTDLPSSARYYVAIRAARVYQARSTGSGSQNNFTQIDERDARAALKRADSRARPRGHFRSAGNARVLIRRPM
jgi:hypothetical protein